jgi:hypothetical protein
MPENGKTDLDSLRIWITPGIVITGILAVVYIACITTLLMLFMTNADTMKTLAGVGSTAIAMIGTLVGFFAGHSSGAMGKEKADAMAMEAMEEKGRAMAEMDCAMNDKENAMEEKQIAMREKQNAMQNLQIAMDTLAYLGINYPETMAKVAQERPDLFRPMG